MVKGSVRMSDPNVGSYRRPTTVEQLVVQLAEHPGSVLAGGTDLVIMRTAGVVERSWDIVDIKAVPELRGVARDEQGSVLIGAATTLQALAGSEAVPGALRDGAALVGGWQTRARATLGGNICRASPAGDTLAGLLVCQGRLELASASGTRTAEARDFFVGPGRTAREPREVLTGIRIAPVPGGSAYLRYTPRRAMDLAVVGVAVHLEVAAGRCVAARIALSAAAPVPVLAEDAAAVLVGTELGAADIERAAQLTLRAADPIDDGRGSRAQRLSMLPVMARRAIARAQDRARSSEGR